MISKAYKRVRGGEYVYVLRPQTNTFLSVEIAYYAVLVDSVINSNRTITANL